MSKIKEYLIDVLSNLENVNIDSKCLHCEIDLSKQIKECDYLDIFANKSIVCPFCQTEYEIIYDTLLEIDSKITLKKVEWKKG